MANIRCAEIAADQLAALQRDQAWQALGQEAALGVVPAFGARAVSLIDSNLAGAAIARHITPAVGPRSSCTRHASHPLTPGSACSRT